MVPENIFVECEKEKEIKQIYKMLTISETKQKIYAYS